MTLGDLGWFCVDLLWFGSNYAWFRLSHVYFVWVGDDLVCFLMVLDDSEINCCDLGWFCVDVV